MRRETGYDMIRSILENMGEFPGRDPMELQELREKIDRVDDELIRLYGERMELTRQVGRWKRENGIPVLDTERERNLLNRVGEKAGEENENGVRALFGFLMAQSRTS